MGTLPPIEEVNAPNPNEVLNAVGVGVQQSNVVPEMQVNVNPYKNPVVDMQVRNNVGNVSRNVYGNNINPYNNPDSMDHDSLRQQYKQFQRIKSGRLGYFIPGTEQNISVPRNLQETIPKSIHLGN